MTKKKILLDIEKDLFETMENLRSGVLEDNDFTFFKIHSCSQQSWIRYILKMGCVQIRKDLEQWKKNNLNN